MKCYNSKISKAELFGCRILNDVAFAGWAAARRTDEDVLLMRQNLEKMEKAVDDPAVFVAKDMEFYSLVARQGKTAMRK